MLGFPRLDDGFRGSLDLNTSLEVYLFLALTLILEDTSWGTLARFPSFATILESRKEQRSG